MTVAITGSTGVVGSAVLRHLLREGHEVRALVRKPGLLPDGVTEVVGDVLDPATVGPLLSGATTVFHLAGVNELCSRNPERMRRVNVEGTANVLAAAAHDQVKVVHTSSAAVLAEAEGTVGNEDTEPSHTHLSAYAASKWEAEQLVIAAGERQPVVLVNPSSVQGAGRSTGTGRLLLGLLTGKLKAMVDTRVSIVDIDDCARGHLLAAQRGELGRRYLLNSFSMNLQELVSVVEGIVGEARPVRYLPPWIVSGSSPLIGGLARLLRLPVPLCAESARTILHGHLYDGSRATRELGLVYTSAEETLRGLWLWAREQKLA